MRRLCIYLMVMLLILSTSSCGNGNNSSSDITSETSADKSTAGSAATSNSETSQDISEQSQSTSSFPSKTGGLNSISTTTKTTSAIQNAEYEVSLLQYHPGLPNFDAEYSFIVKRDGLLVSRDNYSISVNDNRVKVKDGQVIVPYSVRSEGKDVVVTIKPIDGKSKSLKIPSKKWEITFDDDFNGNDLDPSKWSVFEPYLTYGSNPVSYCDPNDCYEVSNGTLKLLIQKKDSKLNGKTFHYKDACISTENKFRQSLGCYVASMKFEPWSGVCAGFWLLPVAGSKRQSVFFHRSNPDWGCGEVDIIEYASSFGEKYSVTEHFWDVNSGDHVLGDTFWANANVADGKFHAIGVAITEDASYYYCDGKLVGFFEHEYKATSASGLKRNPVKNFMLFSYRMGPNDDSNWVGKWNFKDSDFPLVYEVDWCRAYK